jgi:hypothetical protein
MADSLGHDDSSPAVVASGLPSDCGELRSDQPATPLVPAVSFEVATAVAPVTSPLLIPELVETAEVAAEPGTGFQDAALALEVETGEPRAIRETVPWDTIRRHFQPFPAPLEFPAKAATEQNTEAVLPTADDGRQEEDEDAESAPETLSLAGEVYLVGFAVTSVPVFLVTWLFCVMIFGLPLGGSLGWIPGLLTGALAGSVWPVGLAAAVVLLVAVF